MTYLCNRNIRTLGFIRNTKQKMLHVIEHYTCIERNQKTSDRSSTTLQEERFDVVHLVDGLGHTGTAHVIEHGTVTRGNPKSSSGRCSTNAAGRTIRCRPPSCGRPRSH
ncbi:unnamed protein product [Ixodes pacificus]